MLNPKDISEIKFDKVIVGGYDMGAVDEFLDQVEKDYTQLVSENNLLKSKLRQLVKKIEEYRSMDESMRKALGSAQTMAAQIVDKAKQEANNIRAGAQRSGDEVLAEYQSRIAAEQQKLAMAKAAVQDFVTRMTTMYSQGAEMLRTVVGGSADEEPVAAKPAAAPASRAATHFEPTPKPVVEPPKPVVEPPKPVVEPPEPVYEEPKPVIVEPEPVIVEPEPVVVEPEPVIVEPEPVIVEPEPVIVEPDPVIVEPKPVIVEPEPVIVEPEPVDVEPEPVIVEPEPVIVEPEPVIIAPEPVIIEPELPVEPAKPAEIPTPDDFVLPVQPTAAPEPEPIPDLVIPEAKPVVEASHVIEPNILDVDTHTVSAPVTLDDVPDPFLSARPASDPLPLDVSDLQSRFDSMVEDLRRETVKPSLADTAQLPNLPPIPEEKPRPSFTTGRVYPNTVVRHDAVDPDLFDEGETIHLTPKPKFDFDDLKFGDNYDEK